jgi:hypothetical protein
MNKHIVDVNPLMTSGTPKRSENRKLGVGKGQGPAEPEVRGKGGGND